MMLRLPIIIYFYRFKIEKKVSCKAFGSFINIYATCDHDFSLIDIRAVIFARALSYHLICTR